MHHPAIAANPSAFHARNWWRNGRACKVVAVCALLCGIALLLSWKSSVTGYLRHGNFDVQTTYTPTDNAFSNGVGWVLAPIIAGILWVCGRPRAQTQLRWAPLVGAIAIFAIAVSTALELSRANQAWASSFTHHTPRMEPPSGLVLTCLLSFVMIVAGGYFGRRNDAVA
jgi:hypothetical protein